VAAVAHRQLGEFDRSLDLLDRAIALRPDAALLHVGRALTLVGPWLLTGGVADGPVPDAGERLTAAHCACDTASGLDPELAIVPYARAFIALGHDDLPGAATELTEALRLDPELAGAHLALGRVRARQNMGRLASRHFAAAGRLDPSHHAPRLWLRALARPFSRRSRRRGDVDTARLVPEAQRIVEADLRVRGRLGG
jgi:tetratricopeptide (TPR) repeat protein